MVVTHPTQGLLDAYTIRHYKKDFSNLIVAVVGDLCIHESLDPTFTSSRHSAFLSYGQSAP